MAMRWLWPVVLVLGCDDGGVIGLRERYPCQYEPGPITITRCDRGCAVPPKYEQAPCTIHINGETATADISFVIEGVRGTCAFATPLVLKDAEINFYECQ